jgi:hypothetical protein
MPCSGAGVFFVPIPGAKSRKHLEENVRAADIVLTADDLAEIDREVRQPMAFAAQGSRRGANLVAKEAQRWPKSRDNLGNLGNVGSSGVDYGPATALYRV